MPWLNRWRKASTRRALEAARRAQEAEAAAARRRLAQLAESTPEWNAPTRHVPIRQVPVPRVSPLLTPGQRDCGRRS